MKKEYQITQDEAGSRVDRVVKKLLPGIPFSMLQKMIREKDIRVNSLRTSGENRLQVGDIVTYPEVSLGEKGSKNNSDKHSVHISKQHLLELKNTILYEDEYFAIMNKPQGLAVQGGSKTSIHVDGILPQLLPSASDPKLVHRLDRDTSGILVIAKNTQAARHFSRLLQSKKTTIKKDYWALVHGKLKFTKSYQKIELPIKKGHGSLGEQMIVSPDGDEALTHYYLERSDGDFSWLILRPITGRTHQLRVHLSAIHHPIVGDPKYRSKEYIPIEKSLFHNQPLPELFLHARRIRFESIDGEIIDCYAPPPQQFFYAWEYFGWNLDMEKDPFS